MMQDRKKPKCLLGARAWRTAWAAYPPGIVTTMNEENQKKRMTIMETQYSICHERQMTFQTLKARPEISE
jgi:hypothetical protein